MSPKKALYFSIGIRMLMVFFCISICFVKFIESDDETKQGIMEKEKKALVDAVAKADIKSCRYLLHKGVTLDGTLADGSTPLHLAALNSPGEESFELLREFLFYFASPIIKDHEGRTPIHMACMNTKNIVIRNETVGLLVLHGGDLNVENNKERTVVADLVTLQGIDSMGTFLDSWGCLCTEETIEKAKKLAGSSAGIGLGHTDMYQKLLEKHSIEDCSKKNELSAIVLRLLKDDWSEAVHLAETQGMINQVVPEKYGKLSLLFIAILRGGIECAKSLLSKGANVAYVDDWGRNILHIITGSNLIEQAEKIKLIEYVLEKGAQSIGDREGNTIIHMAVQKNYTDLIKFIKEKYGNKISLVHRNRSGDRPVDIALRYGKTKIVEELGN